MGALTRARTTVNAPKLASPNSRAWLSGIEMFTWEPIGSAMRED